MSSNDYFQNSGTYCACVLVSPKVQWRRCTGGAVGTDNYAKDGEAEEVWLLCSFYIILAALPFVSGELRS